MPFFYYFIKAIFYFKLIEIMRRRIQTWVHIYWGAHLFYPTWFSLYIQRSTIVTGQWIKLTTKKKNWRAKGLLKGLKEATQACLILGHLLLQKYLGWELHFFSLNSGKKYFWISHRLRSLNSLESPLAWSWLVMIQSNHVIIITIIIIISLPPMDQPVVYN